MILLQDIIASKYFYQPVWVMAICTVSVMIVGYLFSAYHSRFIDVIKTPFIRRSAKHLSKEDNFLSNPVSILLSVNFLFTSALFILQRISVGLLSVHLDFSFASLATIMLVILLIYTSKAIALKMIGFIFDMNAQANEYLAVIFLVNQLIGIGFIPLIIFNAYGKQWSGEIIFYIGFMLLIAGLILRIWRGATSILSDGKTSPLYLFLYLCTLEVLPLIFGLKLIEKLA